MNRLESLTVTVTTELLEYRVSSSDPMALWEMLRFYTSALDW